MEFYTEMKTMFEFLKNMMGPAESPSLREVLERDPMIVDVRSPFEFDQGHIRGSVNIPVNQLPRDIEEIKSRGIPVVVVCRSGARSKMAAEILREAGVEVYNGGAWVQVEGARL